MSMTLFQIIVALIPVIGLILTGYVVPFLKAKIDAQTLDTIKVWTERAVLAAEAIYKEVGAGKSKKEFVIEFLKEKFNKKKEILTDEQIDILIEAVWEEYFDNK